MSTFTVVPRFTAYAFCCLKSDTFANFALLIDGLLNFRWKFLNLGKYLLGSAVVWWPFATIFVLASAFVDVNMGFFILKIGSYPHWLSAIIRIEEMYYIKLTVLFLENHNTKPLLNMTFLTNLHGPYFQPSKLSINTALSITNRPIQDTIFYINWSIKEQQWAWPSTWVCSKNRMIWKMIKLIYNI